MIKSGLFGLATAVMLGLATTASAATVGNSVIDRGFNDTFSNFGFAFTNDVFDDGTITSWSVFAGNTGDIGLLVLDQVSATEYEIAAIDIQTVSAGLNSFVSSIAVWAGQILGLYQGSGKVDFDFVSGPNDEVYSSNGVFGTAPGVGDSFFRQGADGRDYSISAEVAAVPLPAGLPLLALGIVGLGFARTRRNK